MSYQKKDWGAQPAIPSLGMPTTKTLTSVFSWRVSNDNGATDFFFWSILFTNDRNDYEKKTDIFVNYVLLCIFCKAVEFHDRGKYVKVLIFRSFNV